MPYMDSAPKSYSTYRQPSASSSAPVSLQVSTSTSPHEHDPNEHTARPGNAHHHTQFHTALQVKAEVGDANDYTSSTPGLTAGLTRPLKPIERERLAHLDRLKFFLATAPSRWDDAAQNAAPTPSLNSISPQELPTHPFISGVVPYAHSSFYPSSNVAIDPSTNPTTTYRNTFPQSIPDPIHQHLSHLRAPPHPALNRFLLPNQEFVTCVLWNGLYHISGTDIVRALVFRFEVDHTSSFFFFHN